MGGSDRTHVTGAKVLAIEASPFMIICGRRQNRNTINLEFRHGLAEDTFLHRIVAMLLPLP